MKRPLLGNSAFGLGLFNKLFGRPGVTLGRGVVVVVVVTFFGGLLELLDMGEGLFKGGLLNRSKGLLLRLAGSVVVCKANVVSRFSGSPSGVSVTIVVKSFSSSRAA